MYSILSEIRHDILRKLVKKRISYVNERLFLDEKNALITLMSILQALRQAEQ